MTKISQPRRRNERWQWLRWKAGLTQSMVRQHLRVMGCKVGANAISILESKNQTSLDHEAIACLSYIYNHDGNPANINWILNGLDDPFLRF